MKKNLPLFLLFVFVFLASHLSISKAQIGSFSGSHKVSVSARIGDFYLNLFGWISPFASVILTSDGVLLRGTVADQYGNFSIPEVLIKAGFSHFCLEAVDFKRLGESLTCFTIPPAKGSITMRDIFLPPTIGLSRSEIAEGASAFAFGYTMPGALVTLHLSNGKTLTTYADSTGFYQFEIKGLKAGKYSLFATAEYHKKQSLAPTKKLSLTALSWWEQLLAFLRELLAKIIRFIFGLPLGALWLGLPPLLSIIFLILKIWPEKFTFIYQSRLMVFFTHAFRKSKKHLHHDWFMGY